MNPTTPLHTILPVTVRHAPSSAEQPSDSQLSTLNSQLTLDFTASDESIDRYGDIITASGWKLDAYRRNPVFQNAHQYDDVLHTLGKALITEVRGNSLFQRIQFATDINPFAKIAAGLYANGYLNAVSPGFIPIRWEDPQTNAARPQFGRKFLEQELLEVSAVGIPANPNALALSLKSGALVKSDLHDLLHFCRQLFDHPSPPPAQQLNGSQPSTLNSQLLYKLARDLRDTLKRA